MRYDLVRRLLAAKLMMISVCLLGGCGKPTLYPVSGQVKIDGKPAGGVRVFFWRNGSVESSAATQLGMGFTDPQGRFTVSCGSGEDGIERGSYRVTFSRPLTKGKPMVAGEKPSGAVEGVPIPYSDHKNPENSPVLASIPPSGELIFELPKAK